MDCLRGKQKIKEAVPIEVQTVIRQPKIKVKARPPTFVAFVSGKTQLLESDIRFLTRSLKEDFDLGGIPIRIIQRAVARTAPKTSGGGGSGSGTGRSSGGRVVKKTNSDKRTVSV